MKKGPLYKFIVSVLALLLLGFVLGEIGIASVKHFQPTKVPVASATNNNDDAEFSDVPALSDNELRAPVGASSALALLVLPFEVTQNLPDATAPPAYEEIKKGATETIPVTHGQDFEKGNPLIALIIDDLGMTHSGTLRAMALPAEVTLSFLPYAASVQEQVATAIEKKHEILLHLPMEPIGRDNPGPDALLTTLTPAQNQARLEKALASFSGFVGVNNHMGSKYTADEAGMRALMRALRERKLFFLDSRTGAQSVGLEVAHQEGVPGVGRDVFLDDVVSEEAIREELARAELIARKKGRVVIIGHPHALTLQILEDWLASAGERGFLLVPVSKVLP